jgi:hypothetical protein
VTLQSKLILFQALSGVLFFLWLWQAWLLARAMRALKITTNSSRVLSDVIQAYDLVKAVLTGNETQLTAQKEIVDSVKILNDRLSTYNERLNELNSAVRTKVTRIDNTALKV